MLNTSKFETSLPQESRKEVLILRKLGISLPRDVNREILTLNKMGVDDKEIAYLLYLKAKEQARKKWEN
jgi:hypothetical protein